MVLKDIRVCEAIYNIPHTLKAGGGVRVNVAFSIQLLIIIFNLQVERIKYTRDK